MAAVDIDQFKAEAREARLRHEGADMMADEFALAYIEALERLCLAYENDRN